MEQVLVFTRSKLGASRLASYLDRRGVQRSAIHGDRSQPERTRALEAFKRPVRQGPRRDGRGLARPRHRGAAVRRQLRAAVRAAGLHPPHRPDRPGRRERHCHLARLLDEVNELLGVQRLLKQGDPVRGGRGVPARSRSRAGHPRRTRRLSLRPVSLFDRRKCRIRSPNIPEPKRRSREPLIACENEK